jgi:hypothetical protein
MKILFDQQKSRWLLLGAMILTGLAGAARAADVYQSATMPMNITWTNVTDGATTPLNLFSDGQAAHAGADYFIGRLRDRSVPPGQTATVTCRTPPTGADATFPGDSLTVDTQGSLSYKQPGTRKLTVNKMNLIGTGSFGNAQPNSTCTLYGDVTIHDTPTINMSSASDFRNIYCYATLQGDGTLSLNGDNVPAYFKKFMISGDNNTFSGSLVVKDMLLILDTPKSVYTVQSITLNSTAKLQPTVNILAPSTSLTVAATAQLILDKNLNLAGCTINGTTLTPGTHSGAELAAAYPTQVVNNGGSVTVGNPPNRVGNAWLYE